MKMPKAVIIRTYLIYFLVVMAMVAVLVKTFTIIMDGRNNIFTSTSDKLEQRSAIVEPRRGEILDVNLNPLVTSVSFYDIYMDPVTVGDQLWQKGIGELSLGLSKLFPEKTAREYEEYLREARARKRRYVLIQKKVTNEVRKKVRELPIFRKGRFKGGIIDNKATIIRKRPNDDLLARTLGYVKPTTNDTLLVGLEGAYNSYLKGQNGVIVEQKISHSWKPTGTIVREAINGYDVVTSIDKDIQEVAHTELENQLKTKGGRYGCAIVMDVKTGFIKAMVNLQKTSAGTYGEVYNHAIGTREVPGSTMKLASLMAALEDGKISLSDTVKAVGRYEFYDRVLKDSRPYGYGKVTIKEAFEVSSNVISKVIFNGYRNEPSRYIDRMNQFGLTQKTGVNILGEVDPILSKPGSSQWWGGSLAWMSIGYEFQLTPLELLSFYNAVANDGKYMKPQFVSKIINNRKVIEEFEPIVKHEQIASKSTINAMKEALEGVMVNGTGRNLSSTFFKTAGKTGTAQIANRNKGYGAKGEKKYIASFAGYFPADDPIYSCIVVIAAPTDDIYGASVSGTVFSAIANKVYASSYNYHKAINEKHKVVSVPKVQNGSRYDINTVLNRFEVKKEFNGNQSWVKTASVGGKKIAFSDFKLDKDRVPDVRGMGLNDAMYLLEKQGLVVHAKGYGRVVLQSIKPGTKAVNGGLIELKLKSN
ncbi:peptidoglycan glycosyltransferase [Brumimicrobium salinarum]|uniref:Peptidoglycan glycosyltransferase n=1 Tax=Brumimicrobium salinarum TaxID=2058658 RepID=A0A2I0QZR5_9FLAO|nr:penicillin-binding protein [Brumimicrobium salinarum]PKR79834.1 peptidoglycan glycosyltransferase [Brumimicrobium salinarum]